MYVIELAGFDFVHIPIQMTAQWSSDPTINTPVCKQGAGQSLSRAVSDGSGGAIITWWDQQVFDAYDIYAQRINGNGTTLWNANGVDIFTLGSRQVYPRIIPDDFNGAVIAREDERNGNCDIYAQRVFCSGALAGEEIIIDVPNGGESWDLGSTRYIRWHTRDFNGNVLYGNR